MGVKRRSSLASQLFNPKLIGLSALAGLRFFAGPTLISWGAVRGTVPGLEGSRLGLLTSRRAAQLLTAGLVFESFGDKSSIAPPRTAPPVLATRVLGSALVGAALATSNDTRPVLGAAVGGVIGALTATLASRTRVVLAGTYGVPDLPMGLLEDALIAAGSYALLRKPAPGYVER